MARNRTRARKAKTNLERAQRLAAAGKVFAQIALDLKANRESLRRDPKAHVAMCRAGVAELLEQ